jgi:hypothetical protein
MDAEQLRRASRADDVGDLSAPVAALRDKLRVPEARLVPPSLPTDRDRAAVAAIPRAS